MTEQAQDKLWGGRFTEATDAFVEAFTASVTFDKRMAEQDINGSIAHATMLAAVGVLTDAEKQQIITGLEQIRGEIRAIEEGRADRADNPLKHAPHTADVVAADTWTHAYSRRDAAFPLATLEDDKYWPPVGRVDNVYGDRNLFCSCVPVAGMESADACAVGS